MRTLIFLLCIVSYPSFAQEVLSDWETARRSETVELQYRWIRVGDTLKTRELRTLFNVDAPVPAILKNLSTENNFQLWSVGVEHCQKIDQSGNSWIMYSLFDIPRPFKQRDLITKYTVEQTGNQTLIKMEAVPEYLPQVKGVDRMNNYSGYWLLEDIGFNKTMVKFHSTSFTMPVFPRFIQDPVLQRMLINSFETLIKLSENEPIAKN
jgi:hypothetical protein